MRIAFAQGGAGESLEVQLARLGELTPDRYHIEDRLSGPGRRRMFEMVDALAPGDELLLTSLAVLRLDLAELLTLLVVLAQRSIRIIVLGTEKNKFEINALAPCAQLIADLAAVQEAQAAHPPQPSPQSPAVLTEQERADIRRLGRAGLSPRRIGLIYRRSPKCIMGVLAGGDGAEPRSERRRA